MVNRLENESFLDFCDRLISNKQTYDLDNAEVWEVLFNEQLSPDESRKRIYGLKKIIEKLKSEGFNQITEDDMLNKIRLQQQELQKERYKIQTEKNELNRWLREQARLELFEEKIFEAIKNVKSISVPNYRIEPKNSNKDLVGCYADTHFGKELIIKGLDGEILNEYNPEIFKKRMWELLNRIVSNAEKENINHIHLFDLGDSIEGMLRTSQLMSLRYGVTDSIIEYGNFILHWLNELTKYLSVDFYQTQGNHSDLRLITNKKGDFPHENVEKIINWHIQGMLRNNPNIKIHRNENPLIYTNIVGFDILALHGQNEKNLENSIKDYGFIYNKNIDYLMTGHLHSISEKSVGLGKDTIQVPSIMGIDDYSISLKKTSNPGAKMFVLEEGYGRAVDYNIKL